jgi:hypothetical protein
MVTEIQPELTTLVGQIVDGDDGASLRLYAVGENSRMTRIQKAPSSATELRALLAHPGTPFDEIEQRIWVAPLSRNIHAFKTELTAGNHASKQLACWC